MKLEINYKEKAKTHTNMWRLNNMLLNNEWVNNVIKKEIKGHFKTNENKHATTQNLWETVKEALRGKLIAIQA